MLRYIIPAETGFVVITCSERTYTHAREIPIGFSTGVHVTQSITQAHLNARESAVQSNAARVAATARKGA
jgi:hypothetical protein